MKLKALLVLAVAALAVAGYAYSAAGPNAQLASQDRLYGGGGTDPGCFVPDIGFCRPVQTNFAVDAHATAADTAAAGDHIVRSTREQVTCLAVDGHNAAVGGIITSPPDDGFLFVQFYVDNGDAVGDDLVSPQYINPADPSLWPAGFPYVCPSPDTGAPAFGLVRSFIPVSRGNIVVQDAR